LGSSLQEAEEMGHPRTPIEFMQLYPTEDECSAGDLRASLGARVQVSPP